MLTPAQVTAVQGWLVSTPAVAAMITASDTLGIANYLNSDSTFKVWKSATQVADIDNAIIWANFTPATVAAGAGQDAMNYMLACQGKQFNLQNILSAAAKNGTIATGFANIRAGLQDSLTGIQSGVNGATVGAGWAAVQLAIQRPASFYEQIFATGTGTQVNPGALVVESKIQQQEVSFCIFNDDGTRKI
jgi:hypothetical protein